MPWLKAYQWEHHLWPWHQRINIVPRLRPYVARRILDALGRPDVTVRLNSRANDAGRARWDCIRLPHPRYPRCSLGLILHETAHHLNLHRYKGRLRSHTGSFRRALADAYAETKPILPRLLRAAKQDANGAQETETKLALHTAQRAIYQAEIAAARKAAARTPEAKTAKLEARIRRLNCRIKALTTRRKSAERALRALRVVILRKTPPVGAAQTE